MGNEPGNGTSFVWHSNDQISLAYRSDSGAPTARLGRRHPPLAGWVLNGDGTQVF
jgi:hypothetical protein